MLNNEMKSVNVVTFTTGTDAYGQKRKNGTTTRSIQMLIKVYSQTNVSDIRYNEAEFIGLTPDKALTDANQITCGQDTYEILHIVPSRRFTQVLMKKV